MPQSTIINPQSPIKKRRGAPKGNLTNLKHGFYTSRFKREELLAADKVNPSSLTDEILFVRLLRRRIIDQIAKELHYLNLVASPAPMCSSVRSLLYKSTLLCLLISLCELYRFF